MKATVLPPYTSWASLIDAAWQAATSDGQTDTRPAHQQLDYTILKVRPILIMALRRYVVKRW